MWTLEEGKSKRSEANGACADSEAWASRPLGAVSTAEPMRAGHPSSLNFSRTRGEPAPSVSPVRPLVDPSIPAGRASPHRQSRPHASRPGATVPGGDAAPVAVDLGEP